MPFADINGLRLYYEIHGHGDPVMLLHHGFGCTKMWEKIIPRLVQHGYKAICYDRKGYGQSDPGRDFEEFYVSDRFRPESVHELEAFRDWLGVPSFHLVGQCEGGVVGTDYAAAYPHRVNTVVTSGTLCYSTVPLWEFNAAKFTKSFDELDPDQRAKFIDWHGERAEGLFNQFRQFGGTYGRFMFDLRPTLQSVQCPALVLYPDRSFLFEVEQGMAFYRSLPHGELAVLPKCGHNTYEEQPEEYVAHVAKFLARHRFGDSVSEAAAAMGPVTCAS